LLFYAGMILSENECPSAGSRPADMLFGIML
jgi:hypothetical protein